jgi:predicted outer membrane repeat protein
MVDSPVGGDRWAAGTVMTIRWSGFRDVSTVRIELSRDGGTNWETIVASTAACDGTAWYGGSHPWIVTDGGLALPQTDCQVRVSDTADDGVSPVSGAFTIQARTFWRVSASAPPGGDGLAWTTAFQHPEEARDLTARGDEVWVAKGTYSQPFGWDPTVVLTMWKNCEIYGGFAGTETARAERDLAANRTILDGEGTALQVVRGSDEGVLDGFTIRGGNAFANSSTAFSGGGGLAGAWSVTELTVANCTFEDNAARDDGGAICVSLGSVTLENCVFKGNSAARGGAVFCDGYVVAVNCTFVDNSAAESGGAIYDNWWCGPNLKNCILWANSAPQGPAIHSAADEDVYGAGTPEAGYCNIQGGCPGIGNIDLDPLFVDAASGDYHLDLLSPCIDAGDPATTLAEDVEGNPRPAGSGYDIGAYEHQP